MDRRIKRWKITTPVAAAIAVILIAVAVSAWPRSAAHHPGGDPGGRFMAKLVPVVRAVPGFETGRIPWIAFPCDSCRFPVTYAIKIEPGWDSCDGMAGTFGWDSVRIQAGFRWTGSRQALVDLIDKRLAARGLARGTAPSWGDAGSATWTNPPGQTPAEAFVLEQPTGYQQWMILAEAKPRGPQVSGC